MAHRPRGLWAIFYARDNRFQTSRVFYRYNTIRLSIFYFFLQNTRNLADNAYYNTSYFPGWVFSMASISSSMSFMERRILVMALILS